MRVLLAGSTGVLGQRLVRRLSEHGHQVHGLTRDERGDRIVRDRGGTPIRADLFNPDEITRHVDNVDSIVHAATAIPRKQRPSAQDWAINDEIRIRGVESLIEVARRTGARHLIFQSVVWVARPDDESPFDERAPVNPDEVTQSAAAAERIALNAGDEYGFTSTVLRGGWFYGPDAWHTQSFGERLKKRMLPIIGDGSAYWSILHVDDAANAYLVGIEHQPAGVFHVVDDEPVQVGEFFRYFAEIQGAKPPLRIPAWLARLAAGSFSTDFATTSMITNAEKFKSATGWQPQFPSYREGLSEVVREWEEVAIPSR
ncbi:MAG: NAD(P)-dependent oxidoreductase [Sphaerobacteraceae bacterium]|nr:MAG: NAD(P)-dependent oxidoreductase [Sphaerobacteraceae bacterium]